MDDTDDTSQVDQSAEETVYLDVDPMLESVVSLVNDNPGLEIPITLTVPGSTVTGLLLGVDGWIQAAIDEYGEKNAITGIYKAWQRNFAEDTPEEVASTPPGHIHVRMARFVGGQGLLPTTDGFYWRGRLTAVSSWSVGSMDRS